MKKFTKITAGLAGLMMLGANVASAELSIPQITYSIPFSHTNPNIEIFESGAHFNVVSDYIGWTGGDTKVALGEMDFGEDGNKYKAVSLEMANGWYCDGWAILHAGPDYESSVPFTQIALNETGGYDNFVLYATNFSCNTNQDDWANGPAVEGITYTKPTGKQNLYLTFVGGAGNIRSLNFYSQELVPGDFQRNLNDDGTPGWDDMMALLAPDQYEEYPSISLRLLSTESVAINPEDFPDTRLDGESWGWSGDGFMADYGNVDFGDGGYKQVVINFTHWGENLKDYLEIYVDNTDKSNLLANFWVGRNLENKVYINLAKDLTQNLTGTHKVIAKWIGGGNNLHHIDFVKENVWPIATECGIILEDVEPAEDAFHMTFVDCPEGMGNPWCYAVRCKGQYEAAGNIGYTGNGTVIEFFDINGDGVDLGDGSYKRIIVNHASEPAYAGPIEQANFSFYLDLDPDFMLTDEDFDQNLDDILADHEPFCVVRLQGTGEWGVRKKTAGAIVKPVSGKHSLFMVYNSTYQANTGANVFDIYMDKVEPASVDTIAKDKEDNNVQVYTATGEIIVVADVPTNVEIYSLNGQRVAAATVEGEASIDMARGFYVLRTANANGVNAFKVIVK
ncbi:MAG: T9SS type A sorting domain-containing protein [Muribaculaceae bacterium]|nr:T9SS type A sorting domain-containing protein [Muribaculaceae bacterium]